MNISVTLMGQLSRDKVSPDKLLVTSRLIFSVNRNEQEKQLSKLNKSDLYWVST